MSMSISLPSTTVSPPPTTSLLEVPVALLVDPVNMNGAGTPSGLGGVIGGMLLGVGGPTCLCPLEVVAICLPLIVVVMALRQLHQRREHAHVGAHVDHHAIPFGPRGAGGVERERDAAGL